MRHLIAFALLSTSLAHASTMYCAGPSLFYKSEVKNFGNRPGPDIVVETGRTIIVHDGKVLLDKKYYNDGLGQFGVEPYQVDVFDVPGRKVLEKTGNMKKGTLTFRQKAQLKKFNAVNGNSTTIVNEEVICKDSWVLSI